MAGSLPGKDEAIERLEAYQQRLEVAKQQRNAAYDALFDGAPPGFALHEIDGEGKVTRVNARELEILGRKREAMIGKPVWQFAVMKDASQRAVERKLAGGGLKPFVRTIMRADESPITAAFVERYLKDRQDRVVGIRTAFMVISG